MDFRSFEHNFESNVFVYDREFNSRMRAVFQRISRPANGSFPIAGSTVPACSGSENRSCDCSPP